MLFGLVCQNVFGTGCSNQTTPTYPSRMEMIWDLLWQTKFTLECF